MTVTISVQDDLIVDVLDDGVGVTATVARSGLNNLARRAADAGGTFTLGRPDGGGTRLTWSVPLPDVGRVPPDNGGRAPGETGRPAGR
ncbi:MAG: ATP-binding protein [Actinomycetota bacterium]|nr:ATP-binding protein [Actinomycetota bacterium]